MLSEGSIEIRRQSARRQHLGHSAMSSKLNVGDLCHSPCSCGRPNAGQMFSKRCDQNTQLRRRAEDPTRRAIPTVKKSIPGPGRALHAFVNVGPQSRVGSIPTAPTNPLAQNDLAISRGGNNKMSLLGGTYGSREREISSNDAKRGDDCLQGVTNSANFLQPCSGQRRPLVRPPGNPGSSLSRTRLWTGLLCRLRVRQQIGCVQRKIRSRELVRRDAICHISR